VPWRRRAGPAHASCAPKPPPAGPACTVCSAAQGRPAGRSRWPLRAVSACNTQKAIRDCLTRLQIPHNSLAVVDRPRPIPPARQRLACHRVDLAGKAAGQPLPAGLRPSATGAASARRGDGTSAAPRPGPRLGCLPDPQAEIPALDRCRLLPADVHRRQEPSLHFVKLNMHEAGGAGVLSWFVRSSGTQAGGNVRSADERVVLGRWPLP
jgi:hypothetical protein